MAPMTGAINPSLNPPSRLLKMKGPLAHDGGVGSVVARKYYVKVVTFGLSSCSGRVGLLQLDTRRPFSP
jgi:hypothetical protein